MLVDPVPLGSIRNSSRTSHKTFTWPPNFTYGTMLQNCEMYLKIANFNIVTVGLKIQLVQKYVMPFSKITTYPKVFPKKYQTLKIIHKEAILGEKNSSLPTTSSRLL